MPTLIIVRHGQSQWNLENRFTGEVDVALTALGEEEAKRAGQLLKSYRFDEAYTSVLKRAIDTLTIIIKELDYKDFEIEKSAALNERNYGELQGLNKAEVEKQYGSEQVALWRRSYDAVPPKGESLANTYARVIPYYKKEIEPKLKTGKNILIAAHGNSLRALMMYLENISPVEIANVDLPTGKPKVYEFEDASLKILKFFYLN
ncbi:MAG TPA: 2,3-bisphosphoglycerate-dependent phosphoglycerate mutase [Cytophagaceae bacterium]|jgi:2,3-bisphosphoglycerate-dependent phosphoglycerate mutase|nr:2,3-bisphosphoglycerate-dependent phosphoglycerate mutase [Cytophagaceae bacterium]